VFLPDDTEVDTVAEMRRVWPTIIEVGAGVLEPSDDEDYCLCGIDVENTARVNGARVEHDRGFDEYRVVSRQNRSGAK
jgi:hypothetical protein